MALLRDRKFALTTLSHSQHRTTATLAGARVCKEWGSWTGAVPDFRGWQGRPKLPFAVAKLTGRNSPKSDTRIASFNQSVRSEHHHNQHGNSQPKERSSQEAQTAIPTWAQFADGYGFLSHEGPRTVLA